jgi:hypothetical protein
MKARFLVLFLLLVSAITCREVAAAASPSVSFDGQSVSLSAENGSFGQILELFKQQTGLEYEIPSDLRSERLALVDIHGLSMRAALLKIFEGSNYDYVFIAERADPDKITKVLVTGKSTKISSTVGATGAAAIPRRVAHQIIEDPFGGGGEEAVEDGSINEGEAGNQPPLENPAVPGVVPAQPGVQPQPGALLPGQANPGQVVPGQAVPGQIVPGQVYPPGLIPQQQQGQPLIQPQVLQPQPGNNNNPNNDRRSPY